MEEKSRIIINSSTLLLVVGAWIFGTIVQKIRDEYADEKQTKKDANKEYIRGYCDGYMKASTEANKASTVEEFLKKTK